MLPACAMAGSYTAYVEKDSWLDESAPNSNFGDWVELYCMNSPGDDSRVVMKFDLSPVPTNETVVSAHAYFYFGDPDESGMPLNVHRITDTWGESAVTWNNAHNDFDPAVAGSFVATPAGLVSVDITDLVRGWLNSSYPNRGLMIIPTSFSNTSGLASRESDPGHHRPKLVVTTAGPQMRMATGHYQGNDTDGTFIDVGFTPDLVLVKGDRNEPTMARISTMTGEGSKPLGKTEGLKNDRIEGIVTDGFLIGKHNSVNNLNDDYYWVAFKAAPGQMVVGTYNGNGTGGTIIPTPGMEPDYVIVMNEAGTQAVHRYPSTVNDWTDFFSAGLIDDAIRTYHPGGFEIGERDEVNKGGDVYHFVAWTQAPGMVVGGFYTGNGFDNREIERFGFEPDYVIDGRNWAEDTPIQRSSSMPDDYSFAFHDNTGMTNHIQRFVPDGFQVGNDRAVNENTATYYWVGFRSTPWPEPIVEADLVIDKSVDEPSPAEGDTVVYTIQLTNDGPDAASDVSARDVLPAGVSFVSATAVPGTYDDGAGIWDVGDLANGESGDLILEASVDPGTAGETITNTAVILSLVGTDPDSSNDIASADITVVGADLSVKKGTDDAAPNEGETFRYAIRLHNNGPDDAGAIKVNDLLPAGVTYQSHTASKGSYQSSTGEWVVGDLAAAGVESLVITVEVDAGAAGDTITNTATITESNRPDPLPGNNTSSVDITIPSADLALTKVVDDPAPNEGDLIKYTLTLENRGPDVATGIEVLDILPAGVTYDSHSTNEGDYDPGTGIWTLGAGVTDVEADRWLTILVTVDAGTGGSTITNTATASADQGDPIPENNADSADITVVSADLAVTKIVDDGTPNEGDTINYTVTLDNLGPSRATGVELTDLLPSGVTHVSHTTTQGSYNIGSGLWVVGAIGPDSTATLTLTASVDEGTGGSTITNTAKVTESDQTDPDTDNNTADADIVVESADLKVTKEVDKENPNEEEAITYTVTLTNIGPKDATGVQVTDLLPDGVTYDSHSSIHGTYDPETGVWNIGNVGATQTKTLTLRGTVDGGAGGSTITNTAEVTASDQADPEPDNNSASADITVLLADLSLTKVVDNGFPNEEETVTYSISLTNEGPDDATGIEVTDILPAGVTYEEDAPSQGSYTQATGRWMVGSVAASGSARLDITVTVDGGSGGTDITNTAEITAADQADHEGGNNADSADITVQGADLAVTKGVDHPNPNEGQTVTYTVTLTNNGPDAATNVELTDLLPSGVTYQSHEADQGTYLSGSGLWDVGGVAGSSSLYLDITGTVDEGTAGTVITNTAEISSSDQADPDGENNSASVDITVQSADLAVLKIVDDATPNEGDAVSYTVTLTNEGPDAATGVELLDLLPEGVTYQSKTISQGEYVPATGVWDVGDLSVSASAVLTLTATVDAGTGGSNIINSAMVTAVDQTDLVLENNSGTAGITVQSADLAVVKTVDNPTPSEGEIIEYTVTLSNQGPHGATGVQVTDQLPDGVTFQSSLPEQGSYSQGTGIWNVGELDPSDGVTLILTGTVDIGTGGETITNTASITAADQADPNSGNNSSSAQIGSQIADISLSKSVDDGLPNENGTVNFTVVVTNNGPDLATGLQVTDLIPSGLTYESDAPNLGTYDNGTGIWDVGSLSSGASGQLILTCSVDSGTGGETITNSANVTGLDQADPNGGNNVADASVRIQLADLAVLKVADNATPDEEETITFTVKATNLGPDGATGIEITDLLPAGLLYESHSTAFGSYEEGAGLWTLGDLAAGDTASLTIDGTVEVGRGGSTITNTASVTAADQADHTGGNDTASADVDVTAPLIISALNQSPTALLPGAPAVTVFGLEIVNPSARAETLLAVTLTNANSGTGAQEDLDADWSALDLYLDAEDPDPDVRLATEAVSGGGVTFSGLSLVLPPGEDVRLTARGGASLSARDSDQLDLLISTGVDLDFSRPLAVEGDWPLDPGGSFVVDGMAAAQISLASVPASQIMVGSTHVLALDFVVPANGYEADGLQQVRLGNLGDAQPDTDVDSVRLWKDGGNGAFDAGMSDDSELGTAAWDGGFWVLAGLSEPVSLSGLHLFASVDVDPAAQVGATIQFGLPASPDDGLGMESGNDGPLDAAVTNPEPTTIVDNPEAVLIVTTLNQGEQVFRPGATPEGVLHIVFNNQTAFAETLTAVTFSNTTEGPGETSNLDADWGQLAIAFETPGSKAKRALTSGTFSSGELTFDGLSVPVPPGQIVTGIVTGHASMTARDGDLLDLAVAGSDDLVFSRAVPLQAAWPLDPPGSFTVDGMVRDQITIHPVGDAELLPGTAGQLALDFTAPPNGYEEDLLNQIRLANLGDARPGDDVEAVKLWLDGGDGAFDAGAADDDSLGAASWSGAYWILGGLSVTVPSGGARIFCCVSLSQGAAAGRTIHLSLPSSPTEGLLMASGNDGPLDEPLESTATITVADADASTIVATTHAVGDKTLYPGFPGEEVFILSLVNTGESDELLRSVTLANGSVGPGDPKEMDASWSELVLFGADSDLVVQDSLAAATFGEGGVTFDGLSVPIGVGEMVNLSVWGGATVTARDGDILGLQMTGPQSLQFETSAIVEGDWPLDPNSIYRVDGMTSRQIALNPIDGTFAAGSARNVALSLLVAANGYQEDQLHRLDVQNIGTAVSGSDIVGMEVWVDTGDAAFSAENDLLLGPMTYTGNRWEITALSERVPVGGLLVFVTVGLGELAVEGRTIQLSLPSVPNVSIGMASGNDGPIDAVVDNLTTQVITRVDRVALTAMPVASGTVSPGERGVLLMHLVATNSYDDARTIRRLTFGNLSNGLGDQEELDSAFDVLLLHADGNENGEFDGSPVDPILATATFNDGEATIRNLSWELEPGVPKSLFLAGEISLRNATDGDVLGVQLAAGLDVEFDVATAVAADWPMDSGARWIIDGMVAEQIEVIEGTAGTLGPGEGPVLALDFLLPRNGYTDDVLNGVRVENLGTAGPGEIASLQLWRDGGDGAFSSSSGDDDDLGQLVWSDGVWVSPILDEDLNLGGGRFYVSLVVSETLDDSSSVRLGLPVDGVTVASENDGPVNMPVAGADAILLSSAPLLTTLEVSPSASTVGQTLTLRMVVKNRGQEVVEDIEPVSLSLEGNAVLHAVDGPEPGLVVLGPAEADTILWRYSAVETGEVRFSGHARGRGSDTGIETSSIETTSNLHRVFREATALDLFTVETLPFTVNLGQRGVVPLSFTFRNPGGAEGSTIRLKRLRIRLEDDAEGAIVPSELLKRVVVNEGNQIYLDKGEDQLETSGADVDLRLASPVAITTSEPVTLNLQFDLSEDATTPSFRVVIQDSLEFEAEDATSGSPVFVALQETVYPIRSGLARVVTEATVVEVSAEPATEARVGPAQTETELLEFALESPGIGGITSDVRIGSFAVSVTDGGGQTLRDPWRFLKALRVQTAVQLLAETSLRNESGEEIDLDFIGPLTLPVNSPVTVTLTGDLKEDSDLGSFSLQLEDSSFFDIRDANTRNAIPAEYLTDPIVGTMVFVERPAERISVGGEARLPAVVTVGEKNVEAMKGWFRHPGSEGTARIRVDSLVIQARNQERTPLPPGLYMDRLSLWIEDALVSSSADLPSVGGTVALPAGGLLLSPGDSTAFRIVLDVDPRAPASFLELAIGSSRIHTVDANSGHALVADPDPGSELPLISGLARLRPPARELVVALESRMPAAIAGDDGEETVGLLLLTNAASEGSGSIRVDRLTTQGANRKGSDVSLGLAVEELALRRFGTDWARSEALGTDSTTSMILFPEVIEILPGETVSLEVRARFRRDAEVPDVRLGWDEEHIGIVQPEGALLSVDARAKEGDFPLWTEAGTFSPVSLDESYGNFPNPFAAGREETTFVYYLPTAAAVTLRIWTTRGERVATLLDGEEQVAGLHQSVVWNGRNGRGDMVRNGVYLAELTVDFVEGEGERLLHKVAVVR